MVDKVECFADLLTTNCFFSPHFSEEWKQLIQQFLIVTGAFYFFYFRKWQEKVWDLAPALSGVGLENVEKHFDKLTLNFPFF